MCVILNFILGFAFVHVLLAGDVPQTKSMDEVLGSLFKEEEFMPTTQPTSVIYRSCGLDKECVPRHLCQNDTINTDGTNFIDIRVNDDCKYLELCCDKAKKRISPVIEPVPPTRHEGCGYRNAEGVGYRIQGAVENEAEFGEFPWMVAISRKEQIFGREIYAYICGGALIAPNVIVTAAHCVKNRAPNELVVRAGEWDTQTEAEILPYHDKNVSEIIVHEKFNKGSLWNDIALLFLRDSLNWEENIRPICLPPHNANFDYARCYSTGWGKDKFDRGSVYQSILKRIDVPIVPHDQCQTNLRATRVGRYFVLDDSFICAGGEAGKDTCTGDGGSPLVCPIKGVKDRFYHAGIVAWGIGCGTENVPGVYGNVAYLRPWIDNHLTAKGIDFSYFTP